ncbi:hypothetical protein [Alkalihalobacillus sp. TS-13]|uniref:hypothetical protein n=1 Tax=Alkalihalobacillus sp. TS-13 TaxID=2842455 RepID=UPI001C8774A0|nr:hypothetical protein [Alkalihalobacillus sp. TS-13]
MYRIFYLVLFLLSFYGFLQLIKLVFNAFVPYSSMADIVHICLAIIVGVPFSSFVAGWLTPFKPEK